MLERIPYNDQVGFMSGIKNFILLILVTKQINVTHHHKVMNKES